MARFALTARRPFPSADRSAAGWTRSWSATAVMGIVNVTPDSFSDGGRFFDHDRAIAHGLALAAAGAMIVDVGGESTRPGADPVTTGQEIDRVSPVVTALVEAGVMVSIDTRHAEVAAAAIEGGAHLVNDVGGLRDAQMIDVCATAGVPAVIMHMQGEPATMQLDPRYDDVVAEVAGFLGSASRYAVDSGVPSVIVDPGIGFGKTVRHNLELLRAIPLAVEEPVLVGASRKHFIGALAGQVPAIDRDAGTLAVHLFAAQRGAAIVRVHDVAGHVQALALDRALRGEAALSDADDSQ